MDIMSTAESQTDRNYEVFVSRLPDLVREHSGSFALMHDCGIVGFFGSSLEATVEGVRRFGLGEFSVQEVTETPEHLGFYSYVGGAG